MFTGLRVVELASVLAGPAVGQFFAELGAEVIKVENLNAGGDVTRSWKSHGEETDDRSAYFCSVNWGKQSIAVNLTTNPGKEIIYKLVKDADVVIASYKPGDAKKLGMDYQSLSRIKPDLIYGMITGYGSKNPRVGYDAVIQAESGFMFMNGEPGRTSLKIPVALMDVLAGHQLKEGLLLALLHKERTGKGQLVEVSLIQAALASLANQGSNWLVANKLPQKSGSAHPNIAPYGDLFLSADNKEVLLAVGSDRQFRELCKVLSIPEVSENEKFNRNMNRVANRIELNILLSDRISTLLASDLTKQLQSRNVPAAIIQSIQEALTSAEAKSLFLESEEGIKGLRTFVGNTNNFPNMPHILPPPHFGENTTEVLSKTLHFTPETIEELRSSGVIN